MTLADTGYFLALAWPRDTHHRRAAAWAAQMIAARTLVLVTEYVLVEVVNALSDPADRPKAHRIVARCRGGDQFVFLPASPGLLDAGLALYAARPDKGWSLTDCVSFHVMRQHNLTEALAHDHHFRQAGFEPLQRDP